MAAQETKPMKPGVCIPWEQRAREYAQICGDEKIVRQVWEETDQLAYLYVWFVLTLF